jgi:hypothetical protein
LTSCKFCCCLYLLGSSGGSSAGGRGGGIFSLNITSTLDIEGTIRVNGGNGGASAGGGSGGSILITTDHLEGSGLAQVKHIDGTLTIEVHGVVVSILDFHSFLRE